MKIRNIKLTIKEIIEKTSVRRCLLCDTNLDQDIKQRWHIPLCRKHREIAIKEMINENKV